MALTRTRGVLLLLVAGALTTTGVVAYSQSETPRGTAAVKPSLEDRLPSGEVYSASTQSFLRDQHIFDSLQSVEVHSTSADIGRLEFRFKDPKHELRVRNLPLRQLVPRLHYAPATPPDAFDAYNLMMAEFSRNGLSMPVGVPGDDTVHFESSLEDAHPWSVVGEFQFKPNPLFRPVRVSVVNNCLRSGLWEFSATDRAGEIHHSWFEFPGEYYAELLATTNGLPVDFARRATEWRSEAVATDFGRLRKVVKELGEVEAKLAPDQAIGFSSQGSRRKLERRFALVGPEQDQRRPERRYNLIQQPVWLVDFVEPGKYAIDKRKRFELGFLGQPGRAAVKRVRPLTHYDPLSGRARDELAKRDAKGEAIELSFALGPYELVIGNLPIALLVPQEDYALHGFGVGVLSASGFAERRAILIEKGPAPSFLYLTKKEGAKRVAVNSHELGLEQVFIRTHLQPEGCWWEITLTSFERIVDLVKYRVDVPEELQAELRANAKSYISPLYLTYRDDNLR